MIADRVRTDAYVLALRRLVTSQSVVLDIGTGLGTFAMVAAELGARKVYAVEPDDVIELARIIAQQNVKRSSVEFIQNISTLIELPQRADLIVADLRGVLPLFRQNIPSVIDARRRLLAPHGMLLPVRDDIWAAVVSSMKDYRAHTGAQIIGMPKLELSALDTKLRAAWSRASFEARNCLTDRAKIASIDYLSVERSDLSADFTLRVERSGVAHGYCVWFDTMLMEGVGFSNAPGATKTVYGQAFFPFAASVSLCKGDRIEARLSATLIGDDYIWAWKTRVVSASAGGPSIQAMFAQSSLDAIVVSPEHLRKKRDDYVPPTSVEREIHHFVLDCVDGEASLRDISAAVVDRFPQQFADASSALATVTRVVEMIAAQPN